MRVLVTFAVEAEFAPWLALRRFQQRVLLPDHWSGGIKVYETEIGPNRIWVLLTGMGSSVIKSKILLSMCAKEAGVEICVSSGLAGALKEELTVGEVIAPHRIGTTRDASGIPANHALLNLAIERGARAVSILLTSDHIVETGEEKKRLALFADAVDMESNELMEGFAYQGIPSLTLRAISDASDEDLPINFDQCLSPEGKVKPIPLLQRVLRRPSKILALVRFGVRSTTAAANLATFLDGFVAALTPEIIKTDLGVAAE